jgi:hypothetical protein
MAGGAATSHCDQQRRTAYARVEPHGYGIVPFSVETYGRLGQPAMMLLQLLVDEAADPPVSPDLICAQCSKRAEHGPV